MGYDDTNGWPETLFAPGTTLVTRVHSFGGGPTSSEEVRVARVDEVNRATETGESGGLLPPLESSAARRCGVGP